MGCLQSLRQTVGALLRKIRRGLHVWWSTFWIHLTFVLTGKNSTIMSMESSLECELITQRHKKEVKDLQVKAAAMKKSAPVADKKRRKEILAEVEKLEKELHARHRMELGESVKEPESPAENPPTATVHDCESLPASSESAVETEPSDGDLEVKEADDDINEEERADGAGQKLTRAQKRRLKNQAKVVQRMNELKMDDAKPVQISARTAEKIKLKKILDDYNFKLVEVRSDGNCLYHSLVHQLYLNGTVISVPELRQRTAQYMEKHPDYFKPFLVHHDTGNPFTAEDFAQYLHDLIHTNVWGSQVELRAISADFKWPIRVLQAEGTHVLIGEEYADDEATEPLTIVYHRHELSLGEHYNSVTPK